MMVFGGRNTTGALADLYSLDLTTSQGSWSALNPGGQPPSARYGHVATYSYWWTGTMFLFGGQSDSTHFFGETYILQSQWYRQNPGYSPAPRSQMPVVPGLVSPFWSIFEIIGGSLGDSLAIDVWAAASINAVEEQMSRATRKDKFELTILPNPMRDHAVISFSFSDTRHPTPYTLSLYDLSGRLIRVFDSPSSPTLYWDGKGDKSRPVKEGIYFLQIEGKALSEVHKVIVLH
jgi:hypothetical protein